MTIRSFQQSFGGGEVSPEMFGRIGDTKRQAGLALCRNFIVKPHGPVENRPGTRFVREVKDSTKQVRLIPFTYSTTQTMIIEMGEGYFRFHTEGGTVLLVGVPYEVANPYAEADIFGVHYVQSADVMTLTHPGHAPRELRRLGAASWQLALVDFAPPLVAPVATAAATTGSGSLTYSYVVTAVTADNRESEPSAATTVTNNLFTTGNKNTITWPAVTDADHYIVYKMQGGLHGFMGLTDTLALVDDNIGPDMSKTIPILDGAFAAVDDYPSAVSYFEQRRVFAGTLNDPQSFWMTRSGTESDVTYSLPSRSDDRIKVRVAAREANTIRHVVPLTQLLLLTSAAEWRVASTDGGGLTPGTMSVSPQSYVGASDTQPVIVNNNALYCAARGGHLREVAYQHQLGGYITGDLSLRAPHLFDNEDLVDLAFAKAPYPVVWAVSTSGLLLGMTYIPEQEVSAWHQHDTAGAFESCAVVAEGTEDVLYAVVKRNINGADVRYVERMATRQITDPALAFFVDCGLSYSGAPNDTFTGLDHLEGEEVSILADGAVHPRLSVTAGAVTLDVEASEVQIGLPITADLETLPLAAQVSRDDGAYGQGRVKNVNKVWLRVHQSSGIFAGPNADNLSEYKQRSTEPYGSPPSLKSDELMLTLTPAWSQGGQIFIRQSDPLPLTLSALTAEVAIGG